MDLTIALKTTNLKLTEVHDYVPYQFLGPCRGVYYFLKITQHVCCASCQAALWSFLEVRRLRRRSRRQYSPWEGKGEGVTAQGTDTGFSLHP